jgi:hypothetical protein
VGPFLGADGRTHGFVFSGGTYGVIDVPGARVHAAQWHQRLR